MLDFFRHLFSSDFMPHGHCFFWRPDILWTYVASDAVIALSYYIIPVGLVYLVRRRSDIAFSWMFLLFGLFILSCGTTHVISIVTLWEPMYRLEGFAKALTAMASLPTAILLLRLLPTAVTLPSPEQLRIANRALEAEVAERLRAENDVRRLNLELEKRVAERTAALEASNAQLRHSEQRFRSLIALAPDGIFIADTSGRYEEVNESACRMLGLSRSEIIGKTIEDVIVPEERNRLAQVRSRLLEGQADLSEWRLVRKDGSILPVEVSTAMLPDGRWQAFVRDITERRRAEDEIRRSEARFRHLADAMPQIVWESRPDGSPEYFNHGWREYTGLAPELTSFDAWTTTFHPEDQNEAKTRWQQSLAAGTPYELEFRARRHDGQYRWFLTRALPGFESGRIVRWFGTCTDIHDQKRIEQDLRSANEDLNQFAYAASHDLQEPLRNVSIFSQVLLRRAGNILDPEAQRALGLIREGVQRIEHLLRDLLAYSHAASDPAQSAPLTSASSVLDTALQNLVPAISSTGAEIFRGDLPEVRVHDFHLLQLFQNLLSNALKYRSEQPPIIRIEAVRTGLLWRFFIRDNGIGIDPKYHSNIFGLFRRLHGREQYPGTGIGLAICQKIVERYGGAIWVESQPGDGCTFFFTLPD